MSLYRRCSWVSAVSPARGSRSATLLVVRRRWWSLRSPARAEMSAMLLSCRNSDSRPRLSLQLRRGDGGAHTDTVVRGVNKAVVHCAECWMQV